MHSLIRSALILFGSSAFLPAATYFTENFNSGVIGTNMTLGTGFGSPGTSFTSNNFAITSGDSSRIYLGTVDADYSTVNFVFQATVTVPATNSAWAIVFFGMGNSTAGASVFGEPITGSDVFMTARPDNSNIESRDNATSATGTVQGASTVQNGTHLLRMTWTAATQSAFFEFDSGNNGSIDRSFTVNGADNGFTSSNSQLVLGGGAGLTFDNISVSPVPEPSVALLGGLGALALLRRRRA